MPVKSREIRLKSRPAGPITQDNFAMATVELPALDESEVRIKNLWMSIDAGQRTLMNKGESELSNLDLPAKWFELDEPMEGQAIGQVIESLDENLPVGTLVVTNAGWREYFNFSGKSDGFTLMAIAFKRLGKWVSEGKIKVHETVYDGIENAVQAQIDLFQGKNIGKVLVKLGDLEKIT